MVSCDQLVTTDVLVVGGGLAGMWAALRARQRGFSVAVVDKGTSGHTGCSRFASGDFKCMLPGDDFEARMRRMISQTALVGHQEWLEAMLVEGYERVVELESLGIEFKKNPDGSLHHTEGLLPQLTISSAYLMPKFRQVLERLGVKFFDRSFLYSIVKKRDESVGGAFVLDVREPVTRGFLAKVVILATGSCSMRASYFGHQFSTGDGYAVALDAGCELINMEAVNHNVSLRDFDTTGGTFFKEHGVRYLNAVGEDVVAKHKGLPLGLAMALEVSAQNGPIYMDLSSLRPKDLEEAYEVMPWLKLTLERGSVGKGLVECVPAFGGSRATSAGVRVDIDGRTNVSGLFATGDAAGMLGNGLGVMGVNLLNCSVFGRRCGDAAADYCGMSDIEAPTLLERAGREMRLPKQGPVEYDEALRRLQEVVLPWNMAIVRSGPRLIAGIATLEEIRADVTTKGVAWNDRHSMIKAIELYNMLVYCEALLKSALARTESRGLHYREDYPARNDQEWLKWVVTLGRPGTLRCKAVDMPPEAFKFVRPGTKEWGEVA